MVAFLCLVLLLSGQKAGQSVVQLSFNHQKQDTVKVNSLILFKWEDIRKEAGWFEVHVQPASAKGWKEYEFVDGTRLELRLAKGFVYNVMVMVKDRNDKLLRVSKVRTFLVKH